MDSCRRLARILETAIWVEVMDTVIIMDMCKELSEWNLEQSLVGKREVPSDALEVWQLVEGLREELQRPEEEIKGKFTVQTRVNRVLMCLALSGHERTDFLRDRDIAFSDGSLGSDEACRSGDGMKDGLVLELMSGIVQLDVGES